MRDFLRRRFDYTARTHMRRRARAFDFRFLLAAIAVGAAAMLAIRYL